MGRIAKLGRVRQHEDPFGILHGNLVHAGRFKVRCGKDEIFRAAIGAHKMGYTAVSDGLLIAALVLCAPTVLFYLDQARSRDIEKTYGQRLINVFSGKGQKRLRYRLINAIHMLDKEKKYRKAANRLEELEKHCRTDADYAPVQMFLGDAYRGLRNFTEAECFYRDALSHDSEYGMVWSNLGTILSKLDRHEEAIECHLNAVKYDDKYAIGFNNLAVAYYRCGEYEKCIEPSLKALKLAPRYSSPAVVLSTVYYRLGNKEKSDEYYRMVGLIGGDQKALLSARAEFDKEQQEASAAQAAKAVENADA